MPDPAKSRESQPPRQARRAREPHTHRQPVPFRLRGPREYRLGLKAELRHDLQIDTGLSGEDFLRSERGLEGRFRYLRMAFGVTCHSHVRDAMSLEQARLE